MKKLSLLIALVLLVTIGGVYATWNYAQGDVEVKQGFVLPTMADVNMDSRKGEITIDTSAVTIKVDDSDTDSIVHKPVLVVTGGDIVITFAPAVGADDDIAINGIKMQAVITCTTPWEYDGKQIMTVDTTKNTITATEKGFELRISAEQLAEMLQMNDLLRLPTYSDFMDFQTILNRGNIKIVVSEVS